MKHEATRHGVVPRQAGLREGAPEDDVRGEPADESATSRQQALPWMGPVGQRRLRGARVLIVGAGGVAAPLVQYLAGAGVGRLDIIDFDVIEPSNLGRQLLFRAHDVGRPKATVLAGAAQSIAGGCEAIGHVLRLDARLARETLAALEPDVVIDTTDEWSARFAVADACTGLRVPLVWSSVIGTDAQLTVFPGTGGAPTLDDLVDRDVAPRHPVSCAEQGVLGSVCGQAGAMAATEAIKLIVGAGRPLIGRIAVIDGLGATVREVALSPRAPRGEAGQQVAEPVEAARDEREPRQSSEPRESRDEGDASIRESGTPSESREPRSGAATPVAAAQVAAMQEPRTASSGGASVATERGRAPGSEAAPPSAMPTPAKRPGVAAQTWQSRMPESLRSRITTIAEVTDAPLGTVMIDVREAATPDLPWPPPGLELVELVREPLEELATAIDRGELPKSVERASRVVVTCAFGPRARHAAAMLRAAGVSGVAILDEGTAGLRRAAEQQIEAARG